MSVTGEPGGPPVKIGRAAHRSRRRALRARGDSRGAALSRPHRPRPVHRHVARRSRPGAVGVGVGRVLRRAASRREPMGSAHRFLAPYQAIRCADGYITIGAGTDRLFAALRRSSGIRSGPAMPDFADDVRARAQSRGAHRRGSKRSRRDSRRRTGSSAFEARGIPCGPINTYAEAFADPQVQRARDGRRDRSPDARPHADAGLADQDVRDAARRRPPRAAARRAHARGAARGRLRGRRNRDRLLGCAALVFLSGCATTYPATGLVVRVDQPAATLTCRTTRCRASWTRW